MTSRRIFLKLCAGALAAPVAVVKALGSKPEEPDAYCTVDQAEEWMAEPNELALYNGEEWIFFDMDPQLKATAEAIARRIDEEIYKAFRKARGI